MSFIEQHSIPIFFALLFIILLLVAVISFLLYKIRNIPSDEESSIHSDSVRVSKKEFKEFNDYRRERNRQNGKCSNSNNSDYNKLQDDEYENLVLENKGLKKTNNELSREINELNTLIEKYKKRDEGTLTLKKQEKKESLSKIGSQVIRYASFPRSAGSNSYFSDLTESLADDSYFELKISEDTEEAIFRPLDFMKIRNYDPAMAAMTTEGVKPNMASTILGIEPGKAHLEGKDWIIDKPATIKLA